MSPRRKRPTGSRIPADVAQAVVERAHGYCEMNVSLVPDIARRFHAALSGSMVFHHRQARAMGGSTGRDQDTAENLMYLHDGCHQILHANPIWGRKHGYIVSQYDTTPGGAE